MKYISIKQGTLNYDELVNRLKQDLLYGGQFLNPAHDLSDLTQMDTVHIVDLR